MKTKIKLPVVCVLIGLLVVACKASYLQLLPTPNISPEALTASKGSGMSLVEALATGTSVALTEMAQPPSNPMATLAVLATQTSVAQTLEARVVALTIILPDGTQQGFTLDEVASYATQTLDLFDQPRKAVDLRFLLEKVHWQQYRLFSVTLEGMTSMTFLVNRLPKDAALYLDNGTFNFTSAEIPVDAWPRDVVLIIVH
jgi:hypothetical protein